MLNENQKERFNLYRPDPDRAALKQTTARRLKMAFAVFMGVFLFLLVAHNPDTELIAAAGLSATESSSSSTNANLKARSSILPGFSSLSHTIGTSTPSDMSECTDPTFTTYTLKMAKETPVIGLLGQRQGESTFEASGVRHENGFYYLVSDDLWSIARIRDDLPFNSIENTLVSPLQAHPKPTDPSVHTENGYESLFFDKWTGVWSGVVEAVEFRHAGSNETSLHAVVEELRFDERSEFYSLERKCIVDYTFEDSNLGFEGAIFTRWENKEYMFGLCESNHCAAGAKGKERGNGRLIALEKIVGPGDLCKYKLVKEIHIPSDANFKDYSAIALSNSLNQVAITSQEDSKLWLGTLDLSTMELRDGKSYNFPRNDNCEIVYCNIEGIDFLGPNMLVAASDKMKSRGRQDFRCLSKDQSIHIFTLPA